MMQKIGLDLTPEEILQNPILNKGTSFTREERDSLGLNGYLPYHVSTIEEQAARRYENFKTKRDDISKYTFLSNLQNRNEILFYRLVYDHVAEMMPYIYTPTVGDVSLQFSTLYRQHRGVYFSYPLRDHVEEIVDALPHQEIDVVVATDGERILGLGDVGIGGMAIPQGKLSLYTLFGGIHPAKTLPVMIDVGTNNQELLNDPLYLGWHQPRVMGVEYFKFIDRIVKALQKRFPNILLQWEDFAKPHARPLLEAYRDRICSFNDDIQGTASVALAAILSAIKTAKGKLKKQKIAILGGGSAGLGIAHLILEAMKAEGATEEEARKNFYIVDISGLIHTHLKSVDHDQKFYSHAWEEVHSWCDDKDDKISLLSVVKHAKPNILIGVSAQPDVFTEEIVKTMASYNERPIIFPLSNPTSRCEANPENLLHWTNGKAIIATGSPFPPVEYKGIRFQTAQCNNVYIFPGVGLGVVACKSPKVTDSMFIRAAQVLSEFAPLLKDPAAGIFPDLMKLRDISRQIAINVVQLAQDEGLVSKTTTAEIERLIDDKMWFPTYPTYTKNL